MTYLSNYSPQIVPGGDTSRYFSVLTETSYSKFKPLPKGDFGKAVVDGLVAEGILQPSDLPLIETVFLIHAGHAYPIPRPTGTRRSRRSRPTSSRAGSSRAAASAPGSTRSATRTTR